MCAGVKEEWRESKLGGRLDHELIVISSNRRMDAIYSKLYLKYNRVVGYGQKMLHAAKFLPYPYILQ